MLRFISERIQDYNANNFINELATASKNLGILEEKINSYQFNEILIPMLHKKEARSSMYIEGTQTTMSDIFEDEISVKNGKDKIMLEFRNHIAVLDYGAEVLRTGLFTHTFIKKIHYMMLDGIVSEEKVKTLGQYKVTDNRIVNSEGSIVFMPPACTETKKYMDELIAFMNDYSDGINPLIKAALIHSQFESIHPFTDGNGRVGRLLVSLYLYKAKIINFPFFYLSEAISMDKLVYYNMLTDSRKNTYDSWIKYFLQKIIVQTTKHVNYIESLNTLYLRTKKLVQKNINSANAETIIECLFTKPILTADYMIERMSISRVQALRYLNTLVESNVLFANDKKRSRKYYFGELIDLAS